MCQITLNVTKEYYAYRIIWARQEIDMKSGLRCMYLVQEFGHVVHPIVDDKPGALCIVVLRDFFTGVRCYRHCRPVIDDNY